MTNLQNEEATINCQEKALTALEPTVSALGADVTNLGTLASTQGLSASSSDSSIVSVVNTGATGAGQLHRFRYQVVGIGGVGNFACKATPQPQSVSASGLVNLVVGSNTYQLNLTGRAKITSPGLAQAINNASAGVNASVLTAGSTEYLSVSANNTGATTLQLNNATPADLITSTRHRHGNLVSDLRGRDIDPGLGQRPNAVGGWVARLLPERQRQQQQSRRSGGRPSTAPARASRPLSRAARELTLFLLTDPSGPTTIQLNDLQNGPTT